MLRSFTKFVLILFATAAITMSCEGPAGPQGPQGGFGPKGDKGDQGDQGDPAPGPPTDLNLQAHSITPSLLLAKSGFENVDILPLISSEDQLDETPNFILGGSADGAGLFATSQGFSLLTNHEDNYAVSRISFDKSFKPIAGEYILNSSGGIWRLCSATLATPEEHGFGPVYLTCGESGPESQTHGLNPYASEGGAGFSKTLPALGKWSAENAVPLPKTAYSDRTVILIGDDDFGGSGEVAMYLTDPGKVGDLSNGKVYVMRRVDLNRRELDIVTGAPVSVEFVEIVNVKTNTGAQNNADAATLSAINFGRVEDIDYKKGGGSNGREIYFNVTGNDISGDITYKGRVYKLVLNASNPLIGTLEVILDGDDDAGIAKDFQNPDNILVTENYAYIQEDPNTYGDEDHDAYIYQYNLTTKELKIAFELNHYRSDATLSAKFKSTATKGNWEYGALLDISDIVGDDETFLLNIQPHTWREDRFRNPDGGSIRVNENQASQILILRGLPR